MNILKNTIGLLAIAAVCSADQCTPDSDQKQAAQQETMLAQATDSIGMPAITNFQERRTLKAILELRDQALVTTTYIVDLSGHLHKVCDSIGFGIPYATEYTSPQKRSYNGEGSLALPQADPNGLFSPASAEGTWITCTAPGGKQAVVYVEPRVIVSPYPLSIP